MLVLFTLLFVSFSARAQFRLHAVIQAEGKPLPGATLFWQETQQHLAADSNGRVSVSPIPAGKQRFRITHSGYEEKVLVLVFPLSSEEEVEIELEAAEEEEEEVVVTTTRTSRTIANTPTRVEVISGEELAEKGNMKPGDIRMLLNESTGIQTQQTSVTSSNAGIRIQGLDGRYTQLLRDGLPLYAGFAGGLSILQVAPLDLQQVEVVKGSASTLYGGGAIAGLVNLVTKVPGEQREISFLANTTSAGGLDLSGFWSQRFGGVGMTVFGSRNSHAPFDPAGTGLTAIPRFERYTFHPRLFFYGDKTTGDVGVNYTTENRLGGNVQYIKNGAPGFFELNNTDRLSTAATLRHQVNEHLTLNLKNSYTRFNRDITLPSRFFGGVQEASFSEINISFRQKQVQWVGGVNFLTDGFKEKRINSPFDRSYQYTTLGLFLQNTWMISEKITVESGLRSDYTSPLGAVLLPRFSALVRLSPAWTARIGGGAGYKLPSIFNEEAERIWFSNIRPVDAETSVYERSVGGNADVNYRLRLGEAGLSLNQLFFYTRLRHPFLLSQTATANVFANSEASIHTKGMETNLKLTWRALKLFVGYTFTDAETRYGNTATGLPLTAKHRLNNVVMFEKEGSLKIGLEAYYFGPQRLNDNGWGRAYWITGLMGEKLFKNVSLFVNFENFTDTRQTKFDTVFGGSIDNPVFRDVYAPVDGFVVNGGIKIRL